MIFGLRNVRRMLDVLSSCLDAKRIETIEGVLAKGDKKSIETEWEVVVGYALSHVGKLEDFGKTDCSNPDFIWTTESQPIVVEVTSISDLSLHSQNPVDDFASELRRISIKAGLINSGSLHFDLGSKEDNHKVLLAIPSKQELSAFFQRGDFKCFIKSIKNEPATSHVFEFIAHGEVSKISYLPSQKYSAGHYRSYTAPSHYKHTPVYNALKKKEEQIRKSGTPHPAILFICDNDCAAMRSRFGSSYGSVTMRDIVGLFLNGRDSHRVGDFVLQKGVPAQGSRIHAVIWISVHSEANIFSPIKIKLKAEIEYAVYAHEYIKTPQFLDFINRALDKLPEPKSTPNNAVRKLKYPSFYGGYHMAGNKIKFSALTLQKLLAGEISYADFERDNFELVQHIRRLNDNGSMLDEAEIELCGDQDDDWVSLSFGGINPDQLFVKSG